MIPALRLEKVIWRRFLSSIYSIFILRRPDRFAGFSRSSSESSITSSNWCILGLPFDLLACPSGMSIPGWWCIWLGFIAVSRDNRESMLGVFKVPKSGNGRQWDEGLPKRASRRDTCLFESDQKEKIKSNKRTEWLRFGWTPKKIFIWH